MGTMSPSLADLLACMLAEKAASLEPRCLHESLWSALINTTMAYFTANLLQIVEDKDASHGAFLLPQCCEWRRVILRGMTALFRH